LSSDTDELLQLPLGPELIFGLIAPIGTDLDRITGFLDQALKEMEYRVHRLRLTELMREVPTGLPLDDSPYVTSFQHRIAYANEVRRLLGNEALSVLAVSAIRVFGRKKETGVAPSLPNGRGIERTNPRPVNRMKRRLYPSRPT
jgi:cytidine deaminase